VKTSPVKSTLRKAAFLFIVAGLLQGCGQSSSGFKDMASQTQNEICRAPVEKKSFFQNLVSTKVHASNEPHVLRERNVKVDVGSMRSALLRNQHSKILLDLFEDTSASVKVESLSQEKDQTLTMTGHLVDEPQSSVTLVFRKQTVVGNLSSANAVYEIHASSDQTHLVQEIEPSDNSEECEAVESPEPRNLMTIENSETPSAIEALPVIDMLVAYTPSAKAKAGGKDAIEATIRMGIADTNRAYLDSGVSLSVRLVGTMELTQDETTNYSQDLTSLKSKTDGRWDQVHAERTRLGADQVTVVAVYPGNSVAGIGYISAVKSSAFTIVKISAFRMFTFSHELGHNIGLNHSDGFQNISGGFRTIMAYGTQPRIRRFSHPNIPYNKFLTGDVDHNSALILNSYGKYVASFASSIVPITDVTPPEAPALPIDCQ
jgi:hypothetical protein